MPVGVYGRQVVPRVNNRICGSKSLNEFRRRVCVGLAGEVVEVGFGSGLNVPFYPDAVTAVSAVEPSDVSWRLAASRIAAANVPIRRAGINGESLPFGDATFDSALSTWTLCTIPDAELALRELGRVLRPGGQLHFLDHGLAPDERVRRWQRRLDPLQQRLAGGCHFTRPIAEMIRAAGFTITSLDEFYEPGPKVGGADSLGIAVLRGT
jgi:SAM-dependent methyltransferase